MDPIAVLSAWGQDSGVYSDGGTAYHFGPSGDGRTRAAQREPEKHRDLIVRIGGYSEYFTKLSRALQDSLIARAEYGTV